MSSTVAAQAADGAGESPPASAVLLAELAKDMNSRAKAGQPLTDAELDDCVQSLESVALASSALDSAKLRSLLASVAHRPHKEWEKTMEAASELQVLLLGEADGLTEEFRAMFNRVLTEGNWDGAAAHAEQAGKDNKPWAVLVTGVNGIRKTTSIYESWIEELLSEALITPEHGQHAGDGQPGALPVGKNSFFRQLDHMIATLANRDFKRLYELTGSAIGQAAATPADVQRYSDYKAAVFARYRTLSEILGILLVREARRLKSNVMVETSGRDVAMFKYVDDNFHADEYKKLALHFTVNDLSGAKRSVDARMLGEIQAGIRALESGSVRELILANAGGPYGSEVLEGVQADSDRVWGEVAAEGSSVGGDWYKASILIEAQAEGPWTARAVRPDGSAGRSFAFGPRRG